MVDTLLNDIVPYNFKAVGNTEHFINTPEIWEDYN